MQQAVETMPEMWKRWEGEVVNNRFPLLQYLGGSKHSAVFLTKLPERKDQKVAIKLFSADPPAAELQLSRWAMASKLVHPHLLRLYQMGRCRLGDIPLLFLVMEYAEENLSQVLPHRPLTPSEARETLLPTLEALAFVHGEGFAHGHLKPSNIMAVGDQIKLASDGLWWMGEPSVELGNSGPYDAPEKSTTGISPAGDIWSLGMTLVEALTQRRPVREESGEASIAPHVPSPFLEIARQCVTLDPQQRPTISQIVARFEADKVLPQTSSQPDWKNLATKRILLGMASIALALVAILVVLRLFKHGAQSPAKAPASAVSQPATQSKNQSTTEKPKPGTPSSSAVKPSPAAAPTTALDIEPPPKASAAPANRGGVLHEVIPNVPQSARNTIQGTVRVNIRVAVNPAGKVTTAKFDSPGPSQYFARLAMQAAEAWKFAPLRDQDVRPQWILHFEFQRSGTRVRPVQVSP